MHATKMAKSFLPNFDPKSRAKQTLSFEELLQSYYPQLSPGATPPQLPPMNPHCSNHSSPSLRACGPKLVAAVLHQR